MPTTTRALLRLSLVSLVAAALVAIAAVLSGDLEEPADRILAATAAIALYNATASAGVAVLARAELSTLGAVTIAASALALALALLMIADDWDDGFAEAWGVLTAATLALTQASVALARRHETDAQIVRATTVTTIISGTLLAVLVVVAILAEDPADDNWRLLAVVAVVNVLAMLLTPIVRRLNVGAPVEAASIGSSQPPPVAETLVLPAPALDAEIERLQRGGGKLVLPPVALTGGGRLAAVRTVVGTKVLITYRD